MKILLDSHHPEAEGIKKALESAGYQVDFAPGSPKGRPEYEVLITDAPANDGILRNGNIELDRTRHILKRNKKSVRVTPLEFTIIEYFMSHQGEIIKKDVLAADCWPGKTDVTYNTIEVYIKRIRTKLGASSIRTIHSIGYQMDKKLKIA